jgi:hypothetical protein
VEIGWVSPGGNTRHEGPKRTVLGDRIPAGMLPHGQGRQLHLSLANLCLVRPSLSHLFGRRFTGRFEPLTA